MSHFYSTRSSKSFACAIAFLLMGIVGHWANAEDEIGKQIYAARCASCHGAAGEGKTDSFADPLQGDLALSELTNLIVETMPEEDPDLCVGDEAKQVAEFVFENFYSAKAQARLNNARIELTHLTVRQYRESVADLIGTFKNQIWIPEERGLEANYFAARKWTEDKRLAKQVDATVDYGDSVPYFEPSGEYKNIKKDKDPKKDVNLMNQGFSAFWTGGVIAPETGNYEIIVESKNGFELFVNDMENALLDRRVRSDDVVEHKANLFLLGGRPYGLKLEMFSYPKPPAKIRLLWRIPGGQPVVIPESALIAHRPDESFSVSTAFPADDASQGYERGVSMSQQWDAATTDAAIQTANWISERVWELAKTKANDNNSVEKVKSFCNQFVTRAFAKKLTEKDRQFFIDQHFDNEISIQNQVKRVVIMTLKSPRFLYPGLQQRGRDFELARRMGLTLWDSLPDERIYKLAQKGKLSDESTVHGELYRMVHDTRSRQKLHSFFHHWLKTEHAAEASKDESLFPEFDEELVADLKTSLELYLNDVVWSEDSDFRDLFLADYLYVNNRLAKFYGIEEPESESNDSENSTESHDGFYRVEVDPKQRAGILTHPYLMSGLAYHKTSSPIHRGVFVAKQLLGRRLRQPPNDVKPLTEEFNPEMTTRQRVEHQTKETGCMNCHTVINPLGFSLENFDAVGRFRTKEKAKPINVSTVYKTPEGSQVDLNGPRDLANFLANDVTAQRCFVQQMFNHYAKQPIEAFGADQLDRLHEKFVNNDFHVQQLLVDIALIVVEHKESKAIADKASADQD
jgi:hypothetical protein